MFAIVKRPKYPYHQPKPPATDHRLPPAIVCYLRPPPTATVAHHHPLFAAVAVADQPVATTSIMDIFENLSNFLGNLICISNTAKVSYLEKLFLEITFLKILFP